MTIPTTIAAPPAGYTAPVVTGSNGTIAEPANSSVASLPLAAQERLDALTAEAGRDRTAANAAYDFQNEKLEDLQWARSNFEQDSRQHVSLNLEMAADRRAEHEASIARAKSAHEEAVKASKEAGHKASASRDVLNLARGYLNFLTKKTWAFEPGTNRQVATRDFPDPVAVEIDAALDPGKSRIEMIAIEHERQASLRSEVKRIKVARGGIEEDLAAFEKDLDKRAEEPPFKVVFNGSTFVPRFPLIEVNAEARRSEVPVAPDFLPAWIAANKPAIMAEARQVIEDHYAFSDTMTLTAEEKRARLRQIGADLLASQRVVAAHIWAARAEGLHVAFDPSMCPRSILGIDGPPPPKPRR